MLLQCPPPVALLHSLQTEWRRHSQGSSQPPLESDGPVDSKTAFKENVRQFLSEDFCVKAAGRQLEGWSARSQC